MLNDNGQVVITVAMCASLLLGVVGLGVDFGRYALLRTETVRAADAAALAGVGAMRRDESVEAAVDAILEANAPRSGTFILIGFQPSYIDSELGIVLRGEAPAIFAGLFGQPIIAYQKRAVARHLMWPAPRDVLTH